MKQTETKNLVDGALEELSRALQRGHSEALKAYLSAMGRFSRYSFGNILLIASQRPTATRVAGFWTWKRLGRHVRKGEHGIVILAPMMCRAKVQNSSDDGVDAGDSQEPEDSVRAKNLVGFRTTHVFDVSQTHGNPLPEFATVDGDPRAYLSRLKELVAERGITLEYTASLGGAEGLSAGGRIRLRTGQSHAQEFSTLAHELGHELLHQGEEKLSRTVRETEAEAVAFVVCRAVGLDTNTAFSDYIQLYSGDKDLLAASLGRIQRTAATIIEGLGVGEARRAAASPSIESPQRKAG